MTLAANTAARFGAALLFTSVLAGCNQSQWSAIAEAEQIDFNYIRLQADASGEFALQLNPDTVCRTYQFSERELIDTLRTKKFQRNNLTLSFTFDAISACQAASEVKYQTTELSEPFTDANGIAGRRRPNTLGLANVVTELSNGGVMEVAAFGTKVNGTTTSRTAMPGPIDIASAEVPAGRVGSAASGFFALANVTQGFAEARLTNVLTNPNRFTAEFAFVGKTDPSANEILIVWDGDLVLRTDVED